MSSPRRLLCCFFLLAGAAGFPGAAQTQSNQQTQKVPTIDGGAGPCSLELTVTTPDTKPVYAATIKVHIAYGFAGLHKLDLDAGTDADGKVKFIGLPSRVHRPPLEFQAFKDRLAGIATYNPDSECQAKHDIILETPKPPVSK
ncbi:MAG TPA: hypothetical protein VFA71_15255 [Terriglobales bacterium]|nr:hypothetical protein [Terriglobales bacterium]